jgi:hypothetical protein
MRATADLVVLLCADLQDPPELSVGMVQRLLKEEHTDAVLVIKTSSSGGPLLRMARRGYCRDSAFPHCFGEVRQIKSRRAVLRAEGKNVGVVSMHSAPRDQDRCAWGSSRHHRGERGGEGAGVRTTVIAI